MFQLQFSSIYFISFSYVFPSLSCSLLRIQSIIKTRNLSYRFRLASASLSLSLSRRQLSSVFPKHYHYWIVRVSSPASRFVINSRVENAVKHRKQENQNRIRRVSQHRKLGLIKDNFTRMLFKLTGIDRLWRECQPRSGSFLFSGLHRPLPAMSTRLELVFCWNISLTHTFRSRAFLTF